MPSKARTKFNKNAEDVDTLIELYEGLVNLFEDDPVPKNYQTVLFRSAVVLMVSHWEAYVEDICSEAVEHLVINVADASKLPKELKKIIADEIKKKPHELEMWKLADSGWRDYLRDRLADFKVERDRNFNTPKAKRTEEFLKKAIDVDATHNWGTSELTKTEVAVKLDRLIEVRGEIAHRGEIEENIDKAWVADHVDMLRHLASRTGGSVNAHLIKVTGKPLFKNKPAINPKTAKP